MTRKGAKQISWTTEEDRYLIENAGKVPRREICRRLKRSRSAVYARVRDLKRQGHNIGLRVCKSAEEVCPSCGNASTLMGKDGICEPCRRRDQLAAINARIADLWPLLTQEQRDRYEEADAETGSRHDPYPSPPTVTACMTNYTRQRLMRDWRMECERVEAANLRREVKAAQKRKERIEKKVETST